MASSINPAPGTKYGPCVDVRNCNHRDCQAGRAIAVSVCYRCGKPIGYGVHYYDNPLVHAVCEELAIESEYLDRQF